MPIEPELGKRLVDMRVVNWGTTLLTWLRGDPSSSWLLSNPAQTPPNGISH